MKIGTLCYATDSGLGILAKSFVDNGIVTHPYIVRHGHHQTHEEWYPGAPITNTLRNRPQIFEFVRSMDVMIFFETPFIWELIPHCQAHGVKTVIMPMYECMPKVLPSYPDLFLCPSLLDRQYFPDSEMTQGNPTYADSIYLPVPVDIPWRQRTRAEVFVHNAGHGGLKGRNGTRELLEALWMCDSAKGNGDARFIIRSQKPFPVEWSGPRGDMSGRIKWLTGTHPYESLWPEGDVFIFPERHNGLSLPLQEARAAGMLVMGSDRFPINTWLPREPLIPVSHYETTCISPRCVEFQSAVIDPKAIAATIDRFYGADITEYSLAGKRWAEDNSWQKLKPKYMAVLEDLVG